MSAASGRESLLFFGPDGSLLSVKSHNISDPGVLYNIMATKMDMVWMMGVALKFVGDYRESVAQ